MARELAAAAANSAGTNHGTLKNGSNANVTLYTLTLSGVSSATAVTALNFMPELSPAYGTTDMRTDGEGKLYVYLPAGKTKALATTDSYAYAGSIVSNAATLTIAYPVSGTVDTGATGASVSGRTVNLYASADASYTNSVVGSATTDESGVYTIYAPNGSYVARVAGVADSYIASVSDAITVSGSAVSGADIILSRAAYEGSAAPTPALISKTDIQAVLNAVTVAGQTVEYGKNTSDATPTEWQDTTTFIGLTPNTTYYFFARAKQAGAVEAGGVSTSLTVTTKTVSAPLSDSGVTYSVKDGTITGLGSTYEYSLNNGTTWQSEPTTDVTFAAENTICVRAMATASAMPSQPQTLGTVAPAAGAPTYSIDFAGEKTTVSVPVTVEYNTTSLSAETWTAGSGEALALTPGTTYYFRIAATDAALAGNVQTLVVPARPGAPVDTTRLLRG